MAIKRVLNYQFSKPDPRTKKFKSVMYHDQQQELLPEQDLCEKGPHVHGVMPPIFDQESEGSCTAHAAVGHKSFLDSKYVPYEPMSRQFFYTVERMFDGDFRMDGGSSLATSADRMLNVGVCKENLWPYVQSNEFKKPTAECYADAEKHKIGAYYQVSGLYEMQKCLSNGFPFVFGIIVPKQLMEDGFDGVLPKLQANDVLVENGQPAGHALLAVGYKKINGRLYFKIRNSWGADWGDHGYFWIDAEDMANADWVSDCFTYRLDHQPKL